MYIKNKLNKLLLYYIILYNSWIWLVISPKGWNCSFSKSEYLHELSLESLIAPRSLDTDLVLTLVPSNVLIFGAFNLELGLALTGILLDTGRLELSDLVLSPGIRGVSLLV